MRTVTVIYWNYDTKRKESRRMIYYSMWKWLEQNPVRLIKYF